MIFFLSFLFFVVVAENFIFFYREKRERRRKEKFREDKCFYRLPTKRLCASCVLSAAEAKNFHDSENFPFERETRFLLFLLFACFSISFFTTLTSSLLSFSIHDAGAR